METTKIPNIIEYHRKRLKISKQELSKALNISPDTYTDKIKPGGPGFRDYEILYACKYMNLLFIIAPCEHINRQGD